MTQCRRPTFVTKIGPLQKTGLDGKVCMLACINRYNKRKTKSSVNFIVTQTIHNKLTNRAQEQATKRPNYQIIGPSKKTGLDFKLCTGKNNKAESKHRVNTHELQTRTQDNLACGAK